MIVDDRRPMLPAVRNWLVPLVALTLCCVSCSKGGTESTFTVRLDDARGLEPGRPVLVRGVRVGSVKELRLLRDAVEVEFTLDSVARTTSDSCASIGTLGVMGDAHLTVELGSGAVTSPSAGMMRACPTLPGINEVTAKAVVALDSLAQASGSLQRYLGAVEKGERALVELKTAPAGSASPRVP